MFSKRLFVVFCAVTLFGVGCEGAPSISWKPIQNLDQTVVQTSQVVLPVEDYAVRANLKIFGEYIQDRFRGYHVADDIEFTDPASFSREIPVVAIADGTVARVGFVSGYGGLINIDHMIDGEIYHALYGHVDLGSVRVKVGDVVAKGEMVANLGAPIKRDGWGTQTFTFWNIPRSGYTGGWV